MNFVKYSLLNFTTIHVRVDSIEAFNYKNIIVMNGETSIPVKKIKKINADFYIELENEINIKYITYMLYDQMKIKVNYSKLYSCEEFNKKYYTDTKLGSIYSQEHSIFRLWAPAATAVNIIIYEEDKNNNYKVLWKLSMQALSKGVWEANIFGNVKGNFYNYEVVVYGVSHEVVDPYATACGINGKIGAILKLSEANPLGFSKDSYTNPTNYTDAIIYETSIRDISSHPDSGIKYKGKFLGLTQENTHSSKGVSTGLNHILELGVTHLQLMPVFDFSFESVDELMPYKYNWGYDPQNYNVPEGSYASKAYVPACRVHDLKKLVFTLHRHGIGVIMDVVFNHIYKYETSNLEKIFPGYYFRTNEDYSMCNGSGCGNDIASERSMVRKFIIDSLKYWTEEYHVDGFRFDLMGIIDTDTLSLIKKEFTSLNKNILLYGEGWSLNTNLPEDKKGSIANSSKLEGIGFFNDKTRDLLKGSTFIKNETGFVNGKENVETSIKNCVMAWSTDIPEFSQLFSSPNHSINYVSCHDDLTLWDKLRISCPKNDEAAIKDMQKLSLGIILTCQGVPFFNSGSEFCRTKNGISNSYNATDIINRIDWNRKYEFADVFQYVKGLISIRKKHRAFRLPTSDLIKKHIEFLSSPSHSIGFMISDVEGETWRNIVVIYNSSKSNIDLKVPLGNWNTVADKLNSGLDILNSINSDTINCEASSLKILYKN
ncbi:type I pullulanase [Clostridium sp. 19966]|uniref:type I pullulanase n=1 Tax=Clostridium sp. 19966 TaxID=2768166 RepID=UPI0028E030AD|nr:type I pullulanase [Clostridium sp. 19966]MDT8715411.1 type I pullulanase [Clostridium sp. 19966]